MLCLDPLFEEDAMKRAALLTLLALIVCAFVGAAGPYQYYETNRSVALFTNTTQETFVGLQIVFTQEIAPLIAYGIGASLALASSDQTTLRYEGSVPPLGSFEIDWALGMARVVAAYWITSAGSLVGIDIHSPTARLSFALPPFGTDTCCETGTCVPMTPVEVTFSGSNSFDPDGFDLVLYEWSWSDGVSAQGETIRRVFGVPGTYVVVLVVWDAEGLSALDTQSFYIPAFRCLPD